MVSHWMACSASSAGARRCSTASFRPGPPFALRLFPGRSALRPYATFGPGPPESMRLADAVRVSRDRLLLRDDDKPLDGLLIHIADPHKPLDGLLIHIADPHKPLDGLPIQISHWMACPSSGFSPRSASVSAASAPSPLRLFPARYGPARKSESSAPARPRPRVLQGAGAGPARTSESLPDPSVAVSECAARASSNGAEASRGRSRVRP